MTFSEPRSSRPGVKLLFGVVVATLGVLGSMLLTVLSDDGASSATSSAAHPPEMSAGPDVLAEIENEEAPATLAVAVDKQQSPKRWTRRELINWFRQWWIERWTDRRSGKPRVTGDEPKATTTTVPRKPSTAPSSPVAPSSVAPDPAPATTTKSVATTAAPTPDPVGTGDKTTTSAKRTTSSGAPRTTAQVTTTTAPPTTEPDTTRPAPTTTVASSTTTSQRPNTGSVFRYTLGSGGSTDFYNASPSEGVSAHGTRVYCVTSHFSHDDPVVFPRRTGAAHAHMFWGNTGADAFSTGENLMTSGNSSCEGGITNRSSYWMPVMFNEADEATVPESIFVYYKSFGAPAFDRSTIQPIPAGLEMLATKQVRGAGDWHFRVERGGAGTELKIWFPECVAVDRSGEPILASVDNISHLSYATDNGAGSGCPSSHPYRIPTVAYIVNFAVPFDSDWYLASDDSTATKGQSLHADYIAAWDAETMDELVECTIQARRSCEFQGRSQLPERFLSPDGTSLYQYSVLLQPDADRTPFGTQIGKSAR